jgi:hypothetical protein
MRFKLRTLLVMVVVVAVLLKAEVTRRRAYYRQQAASHVAEQRKYEQAEARLKGEIAFYDSARARHPGFHTDCFGTEKALRSMAPVFAARTAYHARLAREFQRRWW